MTRVVRTVAALLAAILLSTPAAQAELFLTVSYNDGSEFIVRDAAESLEEALDGLLLEAVNGEAGAYFILMPEGTGPGSITGAVNPLDGGASDSSAGMAASSGAAGSMAMSVDEGAAATPEEPAATGWVEWTTGAIALYFFSPDGEDEGEFWERRPPRLFIRQFPNGDFVVWAGGEGETPPE